MRKFLIAAAIAAGLGAGTAHASISTVTDPTGDFLPSFTGAHDAALDITSFSVDFSSPFSTFLIDTTFAGPIQDGAPGVYVLGIDTGAGHLHPFGAIGEPNVLFDQVAVILKTGAASLGGAALTATISGNDLKLAIPTALLPSTGFSPDHFGFNLWSRSGGGPLSTIADFAPNNATLSAAPEPAAWALMISGFGLAGAAVRGRRKSAAAAA